MRGVREQRFRKLSETEWPFVWNHVKVASGKGPLPDEVRIRTLVDNSALLSGYFRGFGEIGLDRQSVLRSVKQKRKFLKEIQSFISAAEEFFADPDGGSSDGVRYDPSPQRKIIGELRELILILEQQIEREELLAREVEPAPPNTAKPERDKWMARLILVWTDGCKLPSKNSKHLRGFIRDALRPYQTGTLTERMAEQFIERWNRGKIPRPSRAPFGMFNL